MPTPKHEHKPQKVMGALLYVTGHIFALDSAVVTHILHCFACVDAPKCI